MKLSLLITLLLVLSSSALAQSGRRVKVDKPAPPPPPPIEESTPVKPVEPPPVTAEKNQDYRCTDDGSLARILEQPDGAEEVFTGKTVDAKAQITSRPRPKYTREASRAGIQGYVILRVVLQSNGRVGPIRVLRGLPAGLTENAIRAACKIEFKPALKAGKQVAQSVQIEYTFRVADSSIFGP